MKKMYIAYHTEPNPDLTNKVCYPLKLVKYSKDATSIHCVWLYGWTMDKEIFKEFKKRNKVGFLLYDSIPINEGNDVKFFKERMGNYEIVIESVLSQRSDFSEVSYKVPMTDIEYNFSTDVLDFVEAFMETNTFTKISPFIFKSKIVKALSTLGYIDFYCRFAYDYPDNFEDYWTDAIRNCTRFIYDDDDFGTHPKVMVIDEMQLFLHYFDPLISETYKFRGEIV